MTIGKNYLIKLQYEAYKLNIYASYIQQGV